MGEINLEEREKQAIAAIDPAVLSSLIDKALAGGGTLALRQLPLSDCSPHLGSKLHDLERALATYAQAKSAKKRDEARFTVERAGRDLSFYFDRLRERLADDIRDGERFFVDDHIFWPGRFHEDLSVRISFRWRQAQEAEWSHGAITFTHRADTREPFEAPTPKRKPSAAQLENKRQERLAAAWQHLMRLALYTVRDYFQAGGDGTAIPDTFKAVVDERGYLVNSSLNFWQHKPKAAEGAAW